jgi:hypothetical protein
MLLHETDLNAICLSSLVREYKNRGWSFISPDEAYRDTIAYLEPHAATKLNDGRVMALAKEKGYVGSTQKPWGSEVEIERELDRHRIWR